MTAMAEGARIEADLLRAEITKMVTYGAFLEYRAVAAETLPEEELDLLIADWPAANHMRIARYDAQYAKARLDSGIVQWLNPPKPSEPPK